MTILLFSIILLIAIAVILSIRNYKLKQIINSLVKKSPEELSRDEILKVYENTIFEGREDRNYLQKHFYELFKSSELVINKYGCTLKNSKKSQTLSFISPDVPVIIDIYINYRLNFHLSICIKSPILKTPGIFDDISIYISPEDLEKKLEVMILRLSYNVEKYNLETYIYPEDERSHYNPAKKLISIKKNKTYE